MCLSGRLAEELEGNWGLGWKEVDTSDGIDVEQLHA